MCWFFSVALGHTDLRDGDPALCVGSSVSLYFHTDLRDGDPALCVGSSVSL